MEYKIDSYGVSKEYTVRYRMERFGDIGKVNVVATNKADAYEKAVYEEIRGKHGKLPYSAWVESMRYHGREIKFATNEGRAY